MRRWSPTAVTNAARASPTTPSGARSKACCRARPTPTTAFLEVNAGAGGTEAQDWAEMLLRMYIALG